MVKAMQNIPATPYIDLRCCCTRMCETELKFAIEKNNEWSKLMIRGMRIGCTLLARTILDE